jgi:hypothetical protein
MMVRTTTNALVCALVLLIFRPAAGQDSRQPSNQGKTKGGTLSPIAKQIDSLHHVMQLGYHRETLVAGVGQRWINKQKALRTRVVCSSYLCSKGDGPLPVTLINFGGARQDTATVLLRWETSAETNNQRFEVERSLNVQHGFEFVGTVDAAGNTGGKYRFRDLNRWSQITYYRLKQIDNDGTSTYSRIISVKGAWVELSILAYPNPGTPDKMRFRLEGSENAGGISIQLMDVKGVMLYSGDAFIVEKTRSFALPKLPSLTDGMYILKVSNGSETAKVRFIIH